MKRIYRSILAMFALLMIAGAQLTAVQARSYSQQELDGLVAPVALYPDPLLSQVLMASTYPFEVLEAANWTRDHPELQADAATRAAQDQDWDPSVVSLVAFPQILVRMRENPDWMRALGDAFLADEVRVMDTVQRLRRRARDAGNLQSDERLRVEPQGDTIALFAASPGYYYVPYYDPMVVYGPWWWPAHPPVAWAPWPGYARYHRPGVSLAFWWGPPVGLTANYFFGGFDWHRRSVRVVNVHTYYYRPPVAGGGGHDHWRHDPHHRREVAHVAPPPLHASPAPSRASPAPSRASPAPARASPTPGHASQAQGKGNGEPRKERPATRNPERHAAPPAAPAAVRPPALPRTSAPPALPSVHRERKIEQRAAPETRRERAVAPARADRETRAPKHAPRPQANGAERPGERR